MLNSFMLNQVSCPFAFFSLTPTMYLQEAVLQQKEKEYLQKFHPDFFPKESGEYAFALAMTQTINQNIRILKDPLSRAKAMRAHAGIIDEDDNASFKNSAMMLEILTLKEDISEANTKETVHALLHNMNDACYLITQQFQKAFDEGDLQALSALYTRLVYFTKSQKECQTKYDALIDNNQGIKI